MSANAGVGSVVFCVAFPKNASSHWKNDLQFVCNPLLARGCILVLELLY